MRTASMIVVCALATCCSASGNRQEWKHESTGFTFLAPKGWGWHDPPGRSTIDRMCYPSIAKSYLPMCIIRVKMEDPDRNITFPMVVAYAKFKIAKFMVGFRFDEDSGVLTEDGGEIVGEGDVDLPFENDGAYAIHVSGEIRDRGTPAEDYVVIFMRGDTWCIMAFGCRVGEFDANVDEFASMIEATTFVEADERLERSR